MTRGTNVTDWLHCTLSNGEEDAAHARDNSRPIWLREVSDHIHYLQSTVRGGTVIPHTAQGQAFQAPAPHSPQIAIAPGWARKAV
eukprot:2491185-Rhodomonas_salina.3